MSLFLKDHHLQLAQDLVDETKSRPDGLAPVDLETFWADDESARENPFADDCPQVPLGIRMNPLCIFDELGIEEDNYRLVHDWPWRIEQSRKYNDLAEKIVGRRVLAETLPDPQLQINDVKALHDIFEAKNLWTGDSYWLHQAADSPTELSDLLDRVDKRLDNLEQFMLPDGWEQQKKRVLDAGGDLPLYRGQRGPITFAMSVFGVENLIFLIMDNPELAGRFRDTILRAMLERARILDEQAGYTPETAPHGFSFADDNCMMLNAEMYEFFGYPILKGIFDRYSPNPEDRRYQHSDSEMAHLLPVLSKVDLTGTNFGPQLTVTEIRQYLPRAEIGGQLAPFTFSRNEEVNIVAEFIRDYEMAGEKKGLLFTTAGSINNGSRLSGMRLIMAAIQRYGRYR